VRLLVVGCVLLLVPVSQWYWFTQAWGFTRRAQRPIWRFLFRSVLLTGFAAIVYLAFLNFSVTQSQLVWRNSAVSALAGLWISSAIFAYIAVRAVAGISWLWQRWLPVTKRQRHATLSSVVHSAAVANVQPEIVSPGRRRFLQTSTALAGAIPFAGAGYGFVFERLHYQVRHIDLPIAGLPAALDGFRIAQLSDIHIGSYMSAAEVFRAVSMTNELAADLAVVTGDFITKAHDPLEPCIAELSRLRAPLGIWGCNGNHEIYAGLEARAAQLFNKYGMRLLRQENVELAWRGQPFNLIGVDYQRERPVDSSHEPMLSAVEPMVRRDVPNILLSHNPNSFRRSAELGIELMLAGHTHGGQVKVEILDHRFSPARFLTPYVAGLYRRPIGSASELSDSDVWKHRVANGTALVYVNRGLGTIGAPVRIGVPPEISLLTLKRA